MQFEQMFTSIRDWNILTKNENKRSKVTLLTYRTAFLLVNARGAA